MSSKRALTSESPGSSGSGSGRKAKQSKKEIQLKNINIETLRGENSLEILSTINTIKKFAVSKSAVESLLTNEGQIFSCLIQVLQKCVAELANNESVWMSVLRALLSLIANCCNLSTAACLEVKRPHVQINLLSVRILESSRASAEIKSTLLRLLGNLCAHKETALCIANHAALIDEIVRLTDSPQSSLRSQAVRTIRLLSTSSFCKALLMSNVGYYLGRVLIAEKEKPTEEVETHLVKEVVTVLILLAKSSVRDCGRQLASSECCARLLELYLDGDVPGIRTLVGHLCDGSSDVRDRLGGEEKLFDKVLDHSEEGPSAAYCRLLMSFTQDAWGRASLRTSGALDLLVLRLARTTELHEKLLLVSSLRHYIHDRIGLAHLCRSSLFLDTLVSHVRNFLEHHRVVCEPSVMEEVRFRADSPLLLEIESRLNRGSSPESRVGVGEHHLYKDFCSMWSYGSQSPYSRNSSYSALSSPPSSSNLSPLNSGPSSPDRMSCSLMEEEPPSSSNDTAPITMRIDKDDETRTQRHMVEGELWLWAWQTQEDANLPLLIREDVVTCLLDYLSGASSVHSRVGRSLLRMAASRTSVDALLKMQFHVRVLFQLCCAPCRITRFARRCGRCEKSADCGREILREFSQHVDSDFGHAFLVRQLTSEDPLERVKANIARLMLVRDRFAGNRVVSAEHGKPLDNMLRVLGDILCGGNFEEDAKRITYENGPPICCQTIFALSTFVSSRRIQQVFEVDTSWKPGDFRVCRVVTEDDVPDVEDQIEEKDQADHIQTLRFVDKEHRLIAKVPMEDVCENSEYFKGMFSSDLLEKTSMLREFVFDESLEGVDRVSFLQFLHLLSGCRSSCTSVTSARTCAALIQLADRYLCPSVQEVLCAPHGPARRLLTGETLPLFVPTIFSIGTSSSLLDACILVLLRFTTVDQCLKALAEVAHTPLIIQPFITHLRQFVSSTMQNP